MDLSEWDFNAVADRNAKALKDLDDGGETEVWAARTWILIGRDHPAEYYALFDQADNYYKGRVEIEKGGLFDPGTLTFYGIGGGKAELEQHVEAFSKKKVLYG